ncbi:MAG TPA: septal ring lytic transglycosylase RlpA family protein [Xanthobacteraceae bacterium]|jgi:rare lipoprotein A
MRWVVAAVLVTALGFPFAASANSIGHHHSSSGIASVYSGRFSGRATANGERIRSSAFTAAHRSLPFGTLVRVTNARNSRSVIVRINDRGPFVGGRTIDLTPSAARAIGMGSLARVTLAIVGR